MAWRGSTRAARLPKDWPTIRAKVLARDRHACQAQHHHPKCDGRATEVDHITPGDNHHPTNLQSLSTPCHKAKTAADNAAARRARAAAAKRPPEQHPGRIAR